MAPVLDVVRSRDMALTMHCSEPVGHAYPGKGRVTPRRAAGLVAIAGGARLVLAHWGGGLPFYALMPEVAGMLSGVYFDTAASPFLYDGRVFAVADSLVGAERVLAASDFPLMRFGRILAQVEASPLSREAKMDILGRNAARMLGLAVGGPPPGVRPAVPQS